MVEVHDAGGGAHQFGAEQHIEREVALTVIEEEPEDTLGPEARIRVHERVARIAALAVEEVGNGMAAPRGRA